MFEIKVFGYEEARDCYISGWPTKIISLIKPDMPDWGKNHLKLQFDDISYSRDGYIAPSSWHVNRILEFSKDFVDTDKVLVHCQAGISRSTAAAIGILIQHGMSYEYAYNKIENIRPILLPNKLMVSFIDDYFNLEGKFNEFISNIRISRMHQNSNGLILSTDPKYIRGYLGDIKWRKNI